MDGFSGRSLIYKNRPRTGKGQWLASASNTYIVSGFWHPANGATWRHSLGHAVFAANTNQMAVGTTANTLWRENQIQRALGYPGQKGDSPGHTWILAVDFSVSNLSTAHLAALPVAPVNLTTS